jgi:hypothetical protein
MDENLSGMDKQEEAHFYLTIADFCNLVDEYGLDYMAKQSNDLRMALISWMTESEYEDDFQDAEEN